MKMANEVRDQENSESTQTKITKMRIIWKNMEDPS